MNQNKLPFVPRYLGITSDAPKMIPMPMVHLAQTMHRSRAEINIVSKWTKLSFHLTHVT
jgi:hypothetical protein